MTGLKDQSAEADVYAGDATSPQSEGAAAGSVFVFRVEADAEPDTFARVAGAFNIANTAPQRVTLRRESPSRMSISIEIELSREMTADLICRKLEQLTCTMSTELVSLGRWPSRDQ